MSYEYLKKYESKPLGIYKVFETNVFHQLPLTNIEEAEATLGFRFPNQLRDFYVEIGCGHLTTPQCPPSAYKFYATNEILPPLVVAHFYKGIIEHYTIKETDEALNYNNEYWLAHEALELMTPGDLPFFEIGDSSSFLVMKPQSEKPNAVYSEGGILVEEQFSKFIWRLYYEDPSYYSDVLMDYYNYNKLDGKQ